MQGRERRGRGNLHARARVLPRGACTLAPQLPDPTHPLGSPSAVAHLPRRPPAQNSPRRRRWRPLRWGAGPGGAHWLGTWATAAQSPRWLALGESPAESPQQPEHSKLPGWSGRTGRLRPRVRARESRRGGRAPGITCRAPGCRLPGALSGSDDAPGPRGGATHPLGAHPCGPGPGTRSRARAWRLRGSRGSRAPGTLARPQPLGPRARGTQLTLRDPERPL